MRKRETSIVATHSRSDIPSKREPLPHHKLGLQYTASGYGRRIPSEWMVKLPGSNRWRRVYVCIYSNTGTAYVPDRNGDWHVITD